MFAVGYENSSDSGVSSVSYGGQPLLRIIGEVAGTSTFNRVELWYLDEAGIQAATDDAFVVTWGGGTPSQPMYAAVTYEGVDQGDPVSDSASNSTDSSSPNPITATVDVPDGWIAVAGSVSGKGGSYTWGAGWTEGTDQEAGTATMSSADSADTPTPTPTPTPTDLLGIGPGETIVLNSDADVAVAKVSQSGSLHQLVGIESPVSLSLFQCKSEAVGFRIDVGTLAVGEIMLSLTTKKDTFVTGPALRNPDSFQHAQLQKLSPTVIRVFWEDRFGGGDEDFNDCVVEVIATQP